MLMLPIRSVARDWRWLEIRNCEIFYNFTGLFVFTDS